MPRWLVAIPVAVALVLCLPGFQFPFFYDDYDFLSRAQIPGWAKHLPDPNTIFYRPVSREAYFTLLTALGGSPLAGHALNFGLVASAILLLYGATARLLGARAALAAAFLFATFGQVPLLASWVSGCQDLLAINFILLSLWLEIEQRHALAVGAAVMALLSKETAIAAFPALAASGWILARGGRRSRYSIVGYVAAGILWVAVHPLTPILVGRKFMGAEAGYIGLDNPGRWVSLARSILTVLNVPSSGMSSAWLTRLAVPGLLAAAMFLFAWRFARRVDTSHETGLPRPARVGLLGIALALPPLLLTSVFVRHWSPYYVALPAVGGCIALATLSTIAPGRILPGGLCVYIALGVCTRAMPVSLLIPTEVSFYLKGDALETVEHQFRELRPTFPHGARILVYVPWQDQLSVRSHLCRFKAPRWWYRDPTMEITSPELRTDSKASDFLFWVSQDLTVHEVELQSLRPRSIQGGADYLEYQRTVRAYARGLADSGQLDRAVAILLRMPEMREEYQNLDHRLAAMLLLKYGRDGEADQILETLAPIPRSFAVEVVAATLQLRNTRALPVDAPMRAFGLAPSDPEALRAILRTLRQRNSFRLAASVGRELLKVIPGDLEASAAAADSLRGPWPDLLTAPAP